MTSDDQRHNEAEITHRRLSRHRRIALVAVPVVLAVVGVAVVGMITTDDRDIAGDLAPVAPPIPPSGMVASPSCVEVYTIDTLSHRQLAFDGTVTGIDGDEVTFEVNSWYRGGDTSAITVRGGQTFTSVSSAGPSLTLQTGRRLLVAGDDGFMWSCGFSQPYDAVVAEQWQQAFAD